MDELRKKKLWTGNRCVTIKCLVERENVSLSFFSGVDSDQTREESDAEDWKEKPLETNTVTRHSSKMGSLDIFPHSYSSTLIYSVR